METIRYPRDMEASNVRGSVESVRLSTSDAGEVLTLQRAPYVTEAQAHQDFALPPLVQSLDELAAELTNPHVLALGLREGARLVAAVRIRIEDGVAELRRLVVAPDRQGQGLGSRLLRHAEEVAERVQLLRLFTGEHSLANQCLYKRHGYLDDHRTFIGDYQLVYMTKVLHQRS
jgi:GNAT superfamily N-acetyltransferase